MRELGNALRVAPKLISVVVPAYNEEDNVAILFQRVAQVCRDLGAFEVIFVDDGSRDDTVGRICALAKDNPEVRLIKLSRNFGHQMAIKAGLDHANGDCVVSMDADLQHPPALIPEMLAQWRKGYNIVQTRRAHDPSSVQVFKQWSSDAFYAIFRRISGLNVEDGCAEFRLLDRQVVLAIREFHEPDLFLRGLVSWIGFSSVHVDYCPDKRFAGETKYSMGRMVRLAKSGLTSFSVRPLHLATALGVLMSGCSFLYGLYVLYVSIWAQRSLPGWASIVASILLIGGVQLIVLGIIGEYLGRTFLQSKLRPPYLIEQEYFFAGKEGCPLQTKRGAESSMGRGDGRDE